MEIKKAHNSINNNKKNQIQLICQKANLEIISYKKQGSKGYKLKSKQGYFYIKKFYDKNIYLKELKIIKLLTNEKISIPNLFYCGNLKDFSFLIFTYVSGKSLNKISPDEYSIIAQKIFIILKKIHKIKFNKKSLVHGDLQINNFIYSKQKLLIFDFECSKWEDKYFDYAWIFLAAYYYHLHQNSVGLIYQKLWNLIEKNNDINCDKLKFFIDDLLLNRFNYFFTENKKKMAFEKFYKKYFSRYNKI